MTNSESCIYCGTKFNPARGEGDHILPVQLGEFEGDARFRRICTRCNNRIGQSEQQFLCCGPESFLRDVVKPVVPRRRRRGSSHAKAAMGAPGPESTIDRADHHELVTRSEDNPTDVFPVDQIVIHDDRGEEYFIRLFPGMREDQLKERVKKQGVGPIQKVWLHCEEAHWVEFQRLLLATWSTSQMHKLPGTDAGVHPTQGQIRLTVTDHYFRALAKIGFHYYLAHSRRSFRGDEHYFAPIREFIMSGGDSNKFFTRSRSTFAVPYGELASGGVKTPAQWCHVLAADETADTVIVYLQLFVGPGFVPPPHYLTLGVTDNQLIVPSFVWGHVYLYDDSSAGGHHAGRVEELQITRLRKR